MGLSTSMKQLLGAIYCSTDTGINSYLCAVGWGNCLSCGSSVNNKLNECLDMLFDWHIQASEYFVK